MAARPTTYVALLRGVNVGGNATVAMADLRACFERMGFAAVRTYINSGNVVFRAPPGRTAPLERKIERALRRAFGMPLTVVVWSARELDDLVRNLPASWRRGGRGWKRNVIFLRDAIDDPGVLDGLVPKPGVEEVHYRRRVLLWSARTSDLARSTMLKVGRLPIYRDMTVRILSTVRKLHEIVREVDETADR
jgi:uncharacterized protein (DUF1697 family)